jgi:hypothetical protein
MSFFGLGKKLPKPSELAKNARESLTVFEKGGSEKAVQKVFNRRVPSLGM